MNKNLKKKIKENIGGMVALVLTLCIVGGTNTMAGSKWGYYCLPQYGYTTDGGSKTTDNQYVACQLEDIYPENGKNDTYTKMKISAYFIKNELVQERVISEGEYRRFQYKRVLKKGNFITFKMRGNKENLSAYIHIFLDVQ